MNYQVEHGHNHVIIIVDLEVAIIWTDTRYTLPHQSLRSSQTEFGHLANIELITQTSAISGNSQDHLLEFYFTSGAKLQISHQHHRLQFNLYAPNSSHLLAASHYPPPTLPKRS